MLIPVKRHLGPLEWTIGSEHTVDVLNELELDALRLLDKSDLTLRTGRDGCRAELLRTGFGGISNESLAKVVTVRKTRLADRSADSYKPVRLPTADRYPPLEGYLSGATPETVDDVLDDDLPVPF